MSIGHLFCWPRMRSPGTPLEKQKPLASEEILRTIAIFRLINPTANIRLAVGRKLLPEVELRSISEALAEDNPSVNADCVGFVFPMHYFGLPLQVVWHTDASLMPQEPNAQWSHTGAWNWPR